MRASPQQVARELLADAARAARNEDSPSRPVEIAPPLRTRFTSRTLPKATRLDGRPTRRTERISTVASTETAAASSRAVRMFRLDSSAQWRYRVRRSSARNTRRRQVVQQRQAGVMLDRKPAVRRRDEEGPADAAELADERGLSRPTPHVFEHGVAEHDIELRRPGTAADRPAGPAR